jgi:putative spermidine/putrescine transport system substrate-binding protein
VTEVESVRDVEAVTRAEFVRRMGIASAGLAIGPGLLAACGGGGGGESTVNLADIGVGDPGSWAPFTADTDLTVKLISMGNAPSQVLNVLISGGGRSTYDIANIVGGMQKPLVGRNLVKPIDTSKIPNWDKDTYISKYLSQGGPGFDFIGYQGKTYGVPTVLQGDSFAYFPDKTGDQDSYGALYDPEFKGYSALEDNFTTSGQKAALYLKDSGKADIQDPADMTPSEIKTVVDFLIERKKAGQFRTIWASFEDAVNLMTRKEVYVIDCWEPMVFAAAEKKVTWKYAKPKEGFLLWAMAAYIVNNPDRKNDDNAYELLNFMLGGWYGAKIALSRGYMTNPQAAPYAQSHPKEFPKDDAAKVTQIIDNVVSKFDKGGTWQNRWPKHVDVYESEWQRFKSA